MNLTAVVPYYVNETTHEVTALESVYNKSAAAATLTLTTEAD